MSDCGARTDDFLRQQEVSKAKDKELQLEVVAACLSVFTRLDSLL